MQHKFVPKLGSDKINVMDHNKINQYNWGGGGGVVVYSITGPSLDLMVPSDCFIIMTGD